MLTLSARSNFGGITVRRDRLDLGFFLVRPENDPRIVRVEKLPPRKIAHHVNLTAPGDVDRQLESWLREAFAIGGFPSNPAT